ncbi:basic proline-rich protein-like [Choloepus didactylus]|uniref:basic proline-rich protein-like n=1 Tax=Choloepus didactylus TaxID=27675 RepID=UPI00189FFECF|nr:basic proline-rich protein-like [Choloepus didactylus]
MAPAPRASLRGSLPRVPPSPRGRREAPPGTGAQAAGPDASAPAPGSPGAPERASSPPPPSQGPCGFPRVTRRWCPSRARPRRQAGTVDARVPDGQGQLASGEEGSCARVPSLPGPQDPSPGSPEPPPRRGIPRAAPPPGGQGAGSRPVQAWGEVPAPSPGRGSSDLPAPPPGPGGGWRRCVGGRGRGPGSGGGPGAPRYDPTPAPSQSPLSPRPPSPPLPRPLPGCPPEDVSPPPSPSPPSPPADGEARWGRRDDPARPGCGRRWSDPPGLHTQCPGAGARPRRGAFPRRWACGDPRAVPGYPSREPFEGPGCPAQHQARSFLRPRSARGALLTLRRESSRWPSAFPGSPRCGP